MEDLRGTALPSAGAERNPRVGDDDRETSVFARA